MSTQVTSKEYWDRYWSSDSVKFPRYDASHGLFYSCKQLLSAVFVNTMKRTGKNRLRVIDCGCGEGLMVRFLAEQFADLEIIGIEYSEAYYKAARLNAELALGAELIHGDLFDDWDRGERRSFDVVLSFGLIEHFENPSEILNRLFQMTGATGTLVTVIPNFGGLFNLLWRIYDSANYKYHVPISRERLMSLHEELGLTGITTYTLGAPMLPGLHAPGSRTARLAAKIIKKLNRHVLRRIYSQQPSLTRCYPMTPAIACVGYRHS